MVNLARTPRSRCRPPRQTRSDKPHNVANGSSALAFGRPTTPPRPAYLGGLPNACLAWMPTPHRVYGKHADLKPHLPMLWPDEPPPDYPTLRIVGGTDFGSLDPGGSECPELAGIGLTWCRG